MPFEAFSLNRCNESIFKDFDATVFASQVITASYSLLFYFVLFALSAFGVYFKSVARRFSSHSFSVLFLVGLITISINIFTASREATVMLYHRMVSVFLVGVVFILFGATLFFRKPSPPSNNLALGQHQPFMGLLVTIITVPLSITELLILLGSQTAKDKSSHSYEKLWWLQVVNDGQFIVQKFIQVAVYLWLRNTGVRDSYRENAQFYFKVLAFFNFMKWVDAQVNLGKGVFIDGARSAYGKWFEVLYELYKALLIDYRLLCSLLFLEHSIQIKNETDDLEVIDTDALIRRRVMTSLHRKNRNIGFLVGFSCFLTPVTCGLHYVQKLQLSIYVRVVATLLNSLCILGCGLVLLLKNRLDFDKKDQDPKGVKIMVCCLVAVAFTDLMIKAALAEFWAIDQHSFHEYRWAGVELAMRALITLFLMVLYLQVHARALPSRNPDVRINSFLVPVLMLSIMATFVSCLIDQHTGVNGPLDWRVRCEIKQQSLRLLHEAGQPMYLGFLIHVSLHFLFIQTKFGCCGRSGLNEELRPLVAFSSRSYED